MSGMISCSWWVGDMLSTVCGQHLCPHTIVCPTADVALPHQPTSLYLHCGTLGFDGFRRRRNLFEPQTIISREQMGRNVAGLHVDKNSAAVNMKSNDTFHGTVHVAPKISSEKVETNDYELEDHAENGTVADECNGKQDLLGIKSTNHEPEQKSLKAEVQKSGDEKVNSLVKPESKSAVNRSINTDSSEPLTPSVEDEKLTSYEIHANGTKTIDSGEKCSPKSNDVYFTKTTGKSQTISHLVSRNLLRPNENKYLDEEDNWSLASSYPAEFRIFARVTAVSVRTVKSRVTVPVAPSFRCMDRAERRKQFYTKLEEKHKALEQEKLEYAARTKEEEAAAIKQLRKSMTYRANPVPSFYREGPPTMKVELKKLPVTRAKSPNLSRRKSCGDVVKSTPEEKGICARAPRHSVGVFKEGNKTPITTKSRSSLRNVNGTNRPQQSKKPTEKSRMMSEQTTEDLAVQS
ncbi:protein WVD2-like 2 [Forsythia ovata]|uniref:Protein WVD2-like 2 n=1 Tax=Forsythia ovata TaxID=205694 RepID=A0ABD1VHV4_9LAMI